jgi:SAM-dependent methyltransferase
VEKHHCLPLTSVEQLDAQPVDGDCTDVHGEDASSYRRQSFEAWQQAATGWERERDLLWRATRDLSEWMVDHASPRSGETVLELASGIGDTGYLAARRIGAGGRLISTDRAPGMLDAARRRGAELGVTNAEWRDLDAEQMDLPDESVDVVLCRWGYMLMADPVAAVRETRRVLRPRGRLSFAVWGKPELNSAPTLIPEVLTGQGHLPPGDSAGPGMFALSDPADLRALVESAALRLTDIAEVAVDFRYADADEFWRVHTGLSTIVTRTLSTLDEGQIDEARAAIAERLEPYATDDGIEIPGVAIGVAARR